MEPDPDLLSPSMGPGTSASLVALIQFKSGCAGLVHVTRTKFPQSKFTRVGKAAVRSCLDDFPQTGGVRNVLVLWSRASGIHYYSCRILRSLASHDAVFFCCRDESNISSDDSRGSHFCARVCSPLFSAFPNTECVFVESFFRDTGTVHCEKNAYQPAACTDVVLPAYLEPVRCPPANFASPFPTPPMILSESCTCHFWPY